MGARLVLVALLSLLAGAARARAHDAVVLSAGGPAPGLADEARAAAIAAMSADGASVVPDAEVALRISPARLRAVAGVEQARAIAFELEVRLALVIAVWAREGVSPPAAESVVASLFVGSHAFTVTESVGEGTLAEATARAVAALRAQQTRALVLEGAGLGSDSSPGSAIGSGSGSSSAIGSGGPGSAIGSGSDPGSATGSGSGPGSASGSSSGPGLGSGSGSGPGSATESESGSGSRTGPGNAQAESSGSGGGAGATPAYDVIGPTMLLAFGAAGIGLGAYALVDGTCERRGASGVCLRGEDPNVPAGVTLTIAGGLALAGGVIWFITGATITPQPRIDIVLGPEGGIVRARGAF